MPHHTETRHLPYRPDQLFDLVADVARYPEFLPWVAAARIREDDGARVIADLVIGFAAFRETYTSQIEKHRPDRILVTAIDGPLKTLRNEWAFIPDGEGCRLDFQVEFAFRNRLLDLAAARVFPKAVGRMTAAFEARADALYAADGIRSVSANSAA